MKLNDKIIIHNYTNLSDFKVLKMVSDVVNEGKISKTNQGEQYCFASTFKNGVVVSSTRRNNTYTFYVVEGDK